MDKNEKDSILVLIQSLDERIKESVEKQRINREEFIVLRNAVDALHRRMDKVEKDLEGNVTTKVLHKWLVAAATIITSLGVIFGFLIRAFGVKP